MKISIWVRKSSFVSFLFLFVRSYVTVCHVKKVNYDNFIWNARYIFCRSSLQHLELHRRISDLGLLSVHRRTRIVSDSWRGRIRGKTGPTMVKPTTWFVDGLFFIFLKHSEHVDIPFFDTEFNASFTKDSEDSDEIFATCNSPIPVKYLLKRLIWFVQVFSYRII